jgi:hypothetical protein
MKAMTKASAPSGTSRIQPGAPAGARIYGRVRLEGVVGHGDARGRELGYSTANISVPDGKSGTASGQAPSALAREGMMKLSCRFHSPSAV